MNCIRKVLLTGWSLVRIRPGEPFLPLNSFSTCQWAVFRNGFVRLTELSSRIFGSNYPGRSHFRFRSAR